MQIKPTNSKQKGQQYEDLALDYLRKQGLELIARNYKCKWGELDLLMLEQGTLVIIEVRYRKNARYGSALESVTANKQARIVAATKHYIMHQCSPISSIQELTGPSKHTSGRPEAFL